MMIILYPQEGQRVYFVLKKETLQKLERAPNFREKIFSKKILILPKENYLIIKKRFPLLSDKDISNAIKNELIDLYTSNNFSFVWKPLQQGETFKEVAIFAWEKKIETIYNKNFNAKYIIPEDLIFLTKEPTIIVYKRGNSTLIVGSKDDQWKNSLYVTDDLKKDDFEIFLRGLRENIDKFSVKVIGIKKEDLQAILPAFLQPMIKTVSFETFISSQLKKIELKHFKIKEEKKINIEKIFIKTTRIFLIIVIAMQINVVLCYLNYQRAIKEINRKLEDVEKNDQKNKLTLKKAEEIEKEQNFKILIDEVKELENSAISSPLTIIADLSKNLSKESRVVSFHLEGKKVTFLVECRDFLETFSKLRKSQIFSEIKLSNPPQLDQKTKLYRFQVEAVIK